jgi:hypothetical protein
MQTPETTCISALHGLIDGKRAVSRIVTTHFFQLCDRPLLGFKKKKKRGDGTHLQKTLAECTKWFQTSMKREKVVTAECTKWFQTSMKREKVVTAECTKWFQTSMKREKVVTPQLSKHQQELGWTEDNVHSILSSPSFLPSPNK